MPFWPFCKYNQAAEDTTQEDYEQFMLGFRLGCPVEEDVETTILGKSTPAFQRGLAAGRQCRTEHERKEHDGMAF